MKISTRDAALKSRHTHSFQIGVGYIDHGSEPSAPPLIKPAPGPCMPGMKAENGSIHTLIANNNPIDMRWQDKAWEHPTSPHAGNRIAYSPEYLGRVGWTYGKPAAEKKATIAEQPDKVH